MLGLGLYVSSEHEKRREEKKGTAEGKLEILSERLQGWIAMVG